jgi:hypothetical protein
MDPVTVALRTRPPFFLLNAHFYAKTVNICRSGRRPIPPVPLYRVVSQIGLRHAGHRCIRAKVEPRNRLRAEIPSQARLSAAGCASHSPVL